MAALSADKIRATAYPGQGYIANLYTAVADTYYKGAVVVRRSTGGSIKVASNVDGETVVGIVMENVTITSTGYVKVLCKSRVWFDTSAAFAVVTKVGELMVATDDNDLGSAGGNKANIGRVVGLKEGTELLIDMDWVR